MNEQTLALAEIDAIRQALAAWSQSLEVGDWVKWQTHWVEDGVLMPPGHARVVGRKDLVSYMSSNFGIVHALRFSDWTFDGRDDLAVVTNTVRLYEDAAASGDPRATYKQVIVLRKHANGNWMVQTVIFNADQPG
jgi:ketosteroid isomerase-like protein